MSWALLEAGNKEFEATCATWCLGKRKETRVEILLRASVFFFFILSCEAVFECVYNVRMYFSFVLPFFDAFSWGSD